MTDYLYLSKTRCETADQSFELEQSQGLPSVTGLFRQLDTDRLHHKKLSVLIQDDLLHPLRIDLDQKASRRELPQFLAWKSKRFLPWPIDQVSLRFLPLPQENAYLTFSLLDPWTRGIFEGFRARGIHCGYIGGLFMTLLENAPSLQRQTTLAFFDDFYIYASLDQKGAYQNFSIRRLPFSASGALDTRTLIQTDLKALGKEVLVLNFAAELDGEVETLKAAVGRENQRPPIGRSALARFTSILQSRGGGS